MKKFWKFAVVGAIAASLVPVVVDVDDSDEKRKKTSVKSLFYSIDLTTTPSDTEGGSDKTAVSVTIPGLIGDFFRKCKCRCGREIPDEMVEEIADKIDRECCADVSSDTLCDCENDDMTVTDAE